MVDRVELVALDQPLQMRKLDRDHAVVGEQCCHAGDEWIEVWDLREDVLAGEQIGANADTDLYFPGFFSATVSAPCPPIEWPKIALFFPSTGKDDSTSWGSSFAT